MTQDNTTPEHSKLRRKSMGTEEFFTPTALVDEMVKSQKLKYNSTTLEPTCGNGQILDSIIQYKLKDAKRYIKKYKLDEKASRDVIYTVAKTTLAMEYMKDNTKASRVRVKKLLMNNGIVSVTRSWIEKILQKNIIWADSLEIMNEHSAYFDFQFPQKLSGGLEDGVRMNVFMEANRAFFEKSCSWNYKVRVPEMYREYKFGNEIKKWNHRAGITSQEIRIARKKARRRKKLIRV
jgi:hypothetical protein